MSRQELNNPAKLFILADWSRKTIRINGDGVLETRNVDGTFPL